MSKIRFCTLEEMSSLGGPFLSLDTIKVTQKDGESYDFVVLGVSKSTISIVDLRNIRKQVTLDNIIEEINYYKTEDLILRMDKKSMADDIIHQEGRHFIVYLKPLSK